MPKIAVNLLAKWVIQAFPLATTHESAEPEKNMGMPLQYLPGVVNGEVQWRDVQTCATEALANYWLAIHRKVSMGTLSFGELPKNQNFTIYRKVKKGHKS